MSRRLPLIGFGLLVLATIAAFFLIQSLKTKPPLLWPPLRSIPSAINPLKGRVCISKSGMPINYGETKLTLAISHSDSVGVYIVNAGDANGPTVDTLTSGTPMAAAPGPINAKLTAKDSRVFTWNGQLSDGSLATSGTYYFRIVLAGEDRSIDLSQWPIQVITRPPHPRILSVRLVGGRGASSPKTTTGTTTLRTTSTSGTSATTSTTVTTVTSSDGSGVAGAAGRGTAGPAGPAVLSPEPGRATSRVRITFTRGAYRRVWIDIYRTDAAGRPQLAGPPLPVPEPGRDSVLWDGKIDGSRPPPARISWGSRPRTRPVTEPAGRSCCRRRAERRHMPGSRSGT